MIAEIVAALKADPTIVSLVNTRVTDRDVRQSGWEANSYFFDADGVIRTLLMVDDAGAVRSPFGHTATRDSLVYVWGFAPRTTKGRSDLDAMMARVAVLMHRWQVPSTGAFVVPGQRLGQQADDEGAVFDRLSLQVSGVLAVSNF